MSYLRRLKSGSAWALVAKVLVAVCGLTVGAVLARLLGPQHLGSYFLFVQLTGIGALLVSAGMRSGATKLIGIAADDDDWSGVWSVLRLVMVTLLVSCVLASLVLYASWGALSPVIFDNGGFADFGVLVLAAIVLRAVHPFASIFFRAVGQPRKGVLLLNVPREFLLAVSFLTVFVLWSRISLSTTLLVYVGVLVVITIFSWALVGAFYRTHRPGPPPRTSVTWASLVVLTFPMYGHNVASELMRTCDLWILGVFATKADVGIYGTANRMTLAVVTFVQSINLVIPPMAAALAHRRDLNQLEDLMRISATWSMVLSMSTALVFVVFGREILVLVFGAPFESGYPLLAILAASYAINASLGSPAVLLQMSGNERLLMRLTLLMMVFTVALDVLLVRTLGMVGVAIGTGSAVILHAALLTGFARTRVGIWTIPYFRPSTIARVMRERETSAESDRPQ